MRTLLENDGISQRELTHFMSSDPNTVASLLERMQMAGLLARKSHEKDRRTNRLHLQPVGKRKYEEAREIAIRLQKEVLAVLPETHRQTFLEDLALVAEACLGAAQNSPRKKDTIGS
jgi:DNA-binding MarR family transcriptional regulator